MASHNKDKGFTLIEMSIVLVLIGLIIGGVLKGQEMINSTRLKMTINQWDGIKAAWNTFEDKYNGIPGDFNRASNSSATATDGLIDTTIHNGDNDGVIEVSGGTNVNGTADTAIHESQIVWEQLDGSNILAGIESSGTYSRLYSKLSGGEFIIATDTSVAATNDGQQDDDGDYANLVSRQTPMSATIPNASNFGATSSERLLSGKNAYEMDRKFDDDNVGAGSIRVVCAATATNAMTETEDCYLAMEVGG